MSMLYVRRMMAFHIVYQTKNVKKAWFFFKSICLEPSLSLLLERFQVLLAIDFSKRLKLAKKNRLNLLVFRAIQHFSSPC